MSLDYRLFADAADRPLQLRMRPDLIVSPQTFQGREFWVVKDPLTLRYYRFEAEEFAILEAIDGKASPAEIRRVFERRFAPQQLTLAELQHLVGLLYRSSLVVSDAPGQGRQLAQRRRRERKTRALQAVRNVLAIRFRGVDPDRALTWLNQWTAGLFSLPALAVAVVLASCAVSLVAAEFDSFRARLPYFHEFFGAGNWLWLSLTLAGTKVLHELGHGLACKRFGGHCHELGLMLLVGTPCLYCNVSDAWMIPSRWRRAAIGAAGMYFELVLASLCTLAWWFTEPGLIHGLCLNVMFVSSVSTLVFNANPLLKYDGYYILSDLLEIPNLRQKAQAVLERTLARWTLGLQLPADPFQPRRWRWAFALYSVASTAYGWLVTFSILWFVYHALKPAGLQIVGQGLACSAVAGLVLAPAGRIASLLNVPGRKERVSKLRALGTLAVLGGLVAAVLLAPLPYYIPCAVHVQPREAAAVYVEAGGVLREAPAIGGWVEAGQTLAALDNPDVRLALLRLEGQRDRLAARLDSLRQRAPSDDDALLEVTQTEEALAALDRQLVARREDVRRLVVRAPVAGRFIPPDAAPPEPADSGRLPTWSGRPLEPHNLGAALPASTLLGRIAPPGRYEAILAIDQRELEFVQPGQRVDVYLDPYPGRKWPGTIAHLAEREMQVAPKSLTAKGGGELATHTDAQGRERPLDVHYEASVPLDDSADRLLAGGHGRAKIHAGHRTLGQRLWRAICQTVRFEL